MEVISKLKFRYLLAIYFLSTVFLLLTEELVGAMENTLQAAYLYLGIHKYADGHA